MPAHMTMRRQFAVVTSLRFQTTAKIENYKKLYEKFRTELKDKQNTRIGWSDMFDDLTPDQLKRLFVQFVCNNATETLSSHGSQCVWSAYAETRLTACLSK